MDLFALATLPTGADEAGEPPFKVLRDLGQPPLCGLEAYAVACDGPSHLLETDLQTHLYDLLVGLRHLADRELLDFGSINEEASTFYAQSLIAPNGAVSELPG